MDERFRELKHGPPEPMVASMHAKDGQLADEQLAVVQEKVSRGEYEVNSQRVAVAILERIGVLQSATVRGREGGRGLLPEMNVPREV